MPTRAPNTHSHTLSYLAWYANHGPRCPKQTKTGKSYERASIMEHLRRSATDPLTREPLNPVELRPNLSLKEACNQFLDENGWAVDW